MLKPLMKDADEESGEASAQQPLHPMMLESPELRWSFIRKVYSIIAVQLLLTIAVSAVVVTYPPIALFFASTSAGLDLYAVIAITSIIVLCLLYCCRQIHPVNYILLGVYTVFLAFDIGLICSFTSGKVILEAVILTTVVVFSLTAYTFWAAKRGQDFNFLGPFLYGALNVLLVFCIIQIFFPLGKLSSMVYGGLSAIVFCGYIVYDTDNLIKRYTYDEYIWASVSLYVDILNLFADLLTIFGAAESHTAGSHTDGSHTSGSPTDGSPTDGSPTAGSPTDGSPTAGSPTAGSPTAGSPTAWIHTAGSPTAEIYVPDTPEIYVPDTAESYVPDTAES